MENFWLFEIKKCQLKISMAKNNLSGKDSSRINDTGDGITASAHCKDNSLSCGLHEPHVNMASILTASQGTSLSQ